MLALPSSADNAQQPDGVRALKQFTVGERVFYVGKCHQSFTGKTVPGTVIKLFPARPTRVQVEWDHYNSRRPQLYAVWNLQSANAEKPQINTTAEESANKKES
jgi:hypothetical protein